MVRLRSFGCNIAAGIRPAATRRRVGQPTAQVRSGSRAREAYRFLSKPTEGLRVQPAPCLSLRLTGGRATTPHGTSTDLGLSRRAPSPAGLVPLIAGLLVAWITAPARPRGTSTRRSGFLRAADRGAPCSSTPSQSEGSWRSSRRNHRIEWRPCRRRLSSP